MVKRNCLKREVRNLAGGMQTHSDQPLSEINVTPLVDVMLVLLVIFILLAPMFTQALRVDLPKVSAPPSQELKVVDLALNREGQLLMDGDVISAEAMRHALQSRIADEPKLVVRLNADTAIPYGEVAAVMGMVRESGVQRLAFAMSSPQANTNHKREIQ